MFVLGKNKEAVRSWAATPEGMLSEADQCIQKQTQQVNCLDLAKQEELTLKEEQHKLVCYKRLNEQKLQQEKEAGKEKWELETGSINRNLRNYN